MQEAEATPPVARFPSISFSAVDWISDRPLPPAIEKMMTGVAPTFLNPRGRSSQVGRMSRGVAQLPDTVVVSFCAFILLVQKSA